MPVEDLGSTMMPEALKREREKEPAPPRAREEQPGEPRERRSKLFPIALGGRRWSSRSSPAC